MVIVGGSGNPQSSRMRRCSHSAHPSAVSIASACSAWALKYSPACFHSSDFARTPAPAVNRIEHVVAKTQAILPALPSEIECMYWVGAAGLEQMNRVAVALGFKELP